MTTNLNHEITRVQRWSIACFAAAACGGIFGASLMKEKPAEAIAVAMVGAAVATGMGRKANRIHEAVVNEFQPPSIK